MKRIFLAVVLTMVARSWAAAPGQPNLVVERVSWTPQTPQAGAMVRVRYTVRNVGAAPAAPSHVLVLVDNRKVHEEPLPTLQPGSPRGLLFDWKVECGKQLVIQADGYAKVSESSEADNKWARRFDCAPPVAVVRGKAARPPAMQAPRPGAPGARQAEVARRPDLVIDQLYVHPANPRIGDDVKLVVTVKNAGTWGSAPQTVEITRRGDQHPLQGGFTSYEEVPALGAGRTHTIEIPTQGRYLTLQGYRVSAVADWKHRNDELNERNNAREIYFKVWPANTPMADLTLRGRIQASGSRRVGQLVRVWGEVENIGNGQVFRPFAVTLSCQERDYGGPRIVRTYNVSQRLDPGATAPFEFRLRWPTPGAKPCELWIDRDNAVEEYDEQNNYSNKFKPTILN